MNTKNPIGKGSYGIIYTATNVEDGTVVAKRIDATDPRKTKRIRDGLENLTQLNHPNILKIYDVVDEGNLIWIFMEYCPEGDLKTFWGKSELNLEQQMDIMMQLAEGLEYLHDNNVIHRDIKPGNILVASSDPLRIKLTDFDLSKFLGDDYETSNMSSNVGTAVFKAPEFFLKTVERKISYHRSADIFSLGLTYLAMIQGHRHLVPRLETAKDDSESYYSIGSTLATRLRYGIEPVSVLKVGEDLSFSSKVLDWFVTPPVSHKTSIEEAKEVILKLIHEMTHITPDARPKITEVLNDLRRSKRILKKVGTQFIVLFHTFRRISFILFTNN